MHRVDHGVRSALIACLACKSALFAFLVGRCRIHRCLSTPEIDDLFRRFFLHGRCLTLCGGRSDAPGRTRDLVGRAQPNAHEWVLGGPRVAHVVLHSAKHGRRSSFEGRGRTCQRSKWPIACRICPTRGRTARVEPCERSVFLFAAQQADVRRAGLGRPGCLLAQLVHLPLGNQTTAREGSLRDGPPGFRARGSRRCGVNQAGRARRARPP